MFIFAHTSFGSFFLSGSSASAHSAHSALPVKSPRERQKGISLLQCVAVCLFCRICRLPLHVSCVASRTSLFSRRETCDLLHIHTNRRETCDLLQTRRAVADTNRRETCDLLQTRSRISLFYLCAYLFSIRVSLFYLCSSVASRTSLFFLWISHLRVNCIFIQVKSNRGTHMNVSSHLYISQIYTYECVKSWHTYECVNSHVCVT